MSSAQHSCLDTHQDETGLTSSAETHSHCCAGVATQLPASARNRHSPSHLAASYVSTTPQKHLLSPQLIGPLGGGFGFQIPVHLCAFLETGVSHLFFQPPGMIYTIVRKVQVHLLIRKITLWYVSV